MKAFTQYTTVILCATLLIGCKNSEETAANSSLNMQLANNSTSLKASGAYSAAIAPVTFNDNTTTFTITEARMHVRDIIFDTSNTDVVGATSTVNGPYVMDLLSGTASPSNVAFDLPTG